MAIYHLTTKPISRGKGQSAIAAAAYRSGQKLRDEQANEQKFYKARAERIEFTGIFAPRDAPDWVQDRNRFWNEAERAETRKDARLAREIEIALPHELTGEQREWLVKDFVREAFVRNGYAVDVAIHAPDKDSDARNHHTHILIAERRIGPDGFAPIKDPTMNKPEQLAAWREQWANLANRHLERHGHSERIDHRSHADRGVDLEPTVHVGYAAMEMAARGEQSDRMDQLRAVMARNDIRVSIKGIDQEISDLEREFAKTRGRGQGSKPAEELEWSERAGRVAQERSALEWFEDSSAAAPAPNRSKSSVGHSDAPEAGVGADKPKESTHDPDKLEWFEDHNPPNDSDHDLDL